MPGGPREKVNNFVVHQGRSSQELSLEDEKGLPTYYQAGQREKHLGIREGQSR